MDHEPSSSCRRRSSTRRSRHRVDCPAVTANFVNILMGGVFHAAIRFLVAAGLQAVSGVQKIFNLACGSSTRWAHTRALSAATYFTSGSARTSGRLDVVTPFPGQQIAGEIGSDS
jgi:branched-subunit amino acid ABC-type transport system permease component